MYVFYICSKRWHPAEHAKTVGASFGFWVGVMVCARSEYGLTGRHGGAVLGGGDS